MKSPPLVPVLPVELKAKLDPLLRMLSSLVDAERAAASAAAGRQLQRFGYDWHDLVEVLLAEPRVCEPQKPPPPPPPRPEWEWIEASRIVALAAAAARINLQPASAQFLDQMAERARASLGGLRISQKQKVWLNDIARRAGVQL
jgi:hypothetical protein